MFGDKTFLEVLSDSQSMISTQLARQSELKARKESIEMQDLYKALAANEGNPEAVLSSAMSSPSLMKELVDQATAGLGGAAREQRMKTVRRAVWDYATRGKQDIAESPDVFIRWLESNERALLPAFGEEHITNLKFAAELAKKLQSTGPMNRGAPILPGTFLGEGGTLEQTTGTSLRTATSIARATQEGRVSTRGTIAFLLSRALSKASNLRADAVLREMIFDPSITGIMSRSAVDETGMLKESEMVKLNRWLFLNGINYSINDRVVGQDPDPFQFTVDVPSNVDSPQLEPDTTATPIATQILGAPSQPVTPPTPPPVDVDDVPQASIQRSAPPASAPNAPIQPTASELFPNDPTLAAIERRRPAQGIASLA